MKFIKKTQEGVLPQAKPAIQTKQAKPTYRQGDVLLQKIDQLPESAQPVEFENRENSENRIVLAYGEVTGHCHALSTATACMYTFLGERLIDVKEGALLRHEEHATIKLPQGVYKVIQQREYVPEAPPRDVLD